MSTFGRYAVLFAADARAALRDPLLLLLVATPPLTAALLGLGLPSLDAALVAAGRDGLQAYEPLILSLYVSFAPALLGGVAGLVLVEDRDDGALAALRVAPMSFGRLLAARLAPPTLAAVATTIAAAPLLSLQWDPDWPPPLAVGACAVASASTAPVAALAILAFGPSKLAALVAFRVTSLIQFAPALVFFAPSWAPLAWINPSYWPMAAFWRAAEGAPGGEWLGALAIGLAVSAAATAVLAKPALAKAR